MTCRNSDKARVPSLLVSLVFLVAVLTASAALGQGATPSTVVLASLPGSSSVLGQSVTFTATVTGGSGTPTGEVDLFDGSALIGSAQLNASGKGVFSTAILPAGSRSITAYYDGSPTYAVSSSASLPFSVNPRPASLVITASPNSVGVGAAAIITAAVTDAAITGPAGTPGSFLLSGSAANLNLRSNRSHHAAGLLSNGQVLITGGTVGAAASSTVEVYDPASGHFAGITLDLSTARSGHTATLLADGTTTLIAGGEASGKAELYSYDLVTSTGSNAVTGTLQHNRSGHTATLLPNGQVLIIGGTVAGTPVATLEVYDPTTGTFVNVASGTLFAPRSGHVVTLVAYNLLSSQATLLITGGDAVGTAELITYSVSTNTVNQVGNAQWASSRSDHTATLLPNGKTIMIAGGTLAGSPVTAVELYQIPVDLTVFMTFPTVASPTSLKVALSGQTATLMNNDFVLFTGGEADATKSAELYQPSYDPQGTLGFASSDLSDIVSPTGCGLLLGNDGTGNCSVLLTPISLGSLRTITGTYSADGDHNSSATTASLIVVKGTQATVVVDAPLSAPYGQLGLSAKATGGNGTGAYSYDAGTSTACSVNAASGAISTHGTGTCSITATRAGDADWNVSAASVPANITITPAPLKITADDVSKAYGAPLPTLTATYSGLVNGDTSASLTTLPTLSTAATATSGKGTYPIIASGAVDPDYTITYVTGTATVTPAPLTITANNATKAYGAALPSLGATYAGFVNGDTSLTTPPTLTTTATMASHVDGNPGNPYTITAAGAVDSNYTISYVAGTLTVNAVPLTITADSKSKMYGADLPSLTASYAGLVNGDTAASLKTSLTVTPNATNASPVVPPIPYMIAAAGAVDTDYIITYGPFGTLTITPAPLTITADNKTKVYGNALPLFTATYSGLVNGDTAASLTTSPTVTTTATAASDVGPYAITASGAVNSNYAISYVAGAFLTITQATPTITWSNPSDITFGTALDGTQLNATFTWVVAGNTVTWPATLPGSVVYSPAATPPPPSLAVLSAGNRQSLTVNFAPTDTLNYTTKTINVLLNVLKATPTIVWLNPADVTYGTPLTLATQLDAAFTWVVNGTTVTVPPPLTLPYSPLPLTVLNANQSQPLSVNFTSTDAVDYLPATKIDYIKVNQAPTQSVVLVTVVPTSAGLTFTLNAAVSSQYSVANCPFSATVSTTSCVAPSGTVNFLDGLSTLNAAPMMFQPSNGKPVYASYAAYTALSNSTLAPPALGAATVTHLLTAAYDGVDANHNYLATAGEYVTTMLVAAPRPVVSGSTMSPSPTFKIPAQPWAVGGSPVALACNVFDITGLPNSAPTISCTLSTLSAAPDTAVTVTIKPNNSTTAGLKRFSPMFAILGLPALGLLVVGFPGKGLRRRKVLARVGLMLVVLAILGFMGCGGGFHNTTVPISTGAGTVPGTYYVVVKGTYSTTTTVNGVPTPGTAETAVWAMPVQVQ